MKTSQHKRFWYEGLLYTHLLPPRVWLTELDLDGTRVTGQSTALSPLTRMTKLDLKGTVVVYYGAFCVVGGPFRWHCGWS